MSQTRKSPADEPLILENYIQRGGSKMNYLLQQISQRTHRQPITLQCSRVSTVIWHLRGSCDVRYTSGVPTLIIPRP